MWSENVLTLYGGVNSFNAFVGDSYVSSTVSSKKVSSLEDNCV